MQKLKVLDLFSGIGGFQSWSGAHWWIFHGRLLRDRRVPPPRLGETLAGGALLS